MRRFVSEIISNLRELDVLKGKVLDPLFSQADLFKRVVVQKFS